MILKKEHSFYFCVSCNAKVNIVNINYLIG